eukprot:Nk52_evm4s259 gene=Nk52_evmTU4s259
MNKETMRSKGPIDCMAGCVPVRLSCADAQPQIMLVKLSSKKKTIKLFDRKTIDSMHDIRNTADYDKHFNIEWAIPRGKKKRRESAEEAAQRESKKQMGLTGTITNYLGDFYHSGEHAVIKTYIMNVNDKQQWKSKDCSKIRRWFTLAEAEAVMVGPILSEIWRRIVVLHNQKSLFPEDNSKDMSEFRLSDEYEQTCSSSLSERSSSSICLYKTYTPAATVPPGQSRHLPLFKTFFIDFEHVDKSASGSSEWDFEGRKVSCSSSSTYSYSSQRDSTSTCTITSPRSSKVSFSGVRASSSGSEKLRHLPGRISSLSLSSM